MKKTLLSICAFIFGAVMLNAQIINENFDSYTAGNPAAQQAGAPWTTWSLAPGGAEDAIVSSTQSSSPSNSAYIGTTSTDFVVQLGDSTTGIYQITFDYFVETGKMGYFNILNVFNGSSSVWAMESYARSNGYLSWLAGGSKDSTTFSFDTWMEIGFNINLNTDTAIMSIDGTDVMGWKFSSGSDGTGTTLKLSAMDFYGAAEDVQPGFYIDDFKFEKVTSVGITELNNSVSVYPNPATDAITLAGQANSRYEIFNTTGQVLISGVLTSNTESIDISNLSQGNYFIRCIGNDVVVNSFIVE